MTLLSMSRHWEGVFFFQKIFTCLPHFISSNSIHAYEYKSINIEKSQFKHVH